MTGIIHLYIPPSDSKQLHDQIVEAARKQRQTARPDAYARVLFQHLLSLDRDRNPYLHEWGHILQTIAHPYLYLRAIRGPIVINTILRDLRDCDEPALPLKLPLDEEFAVSLAMDDTMFRLGFEQAPLVTLELLEDRGSQGRNDLCENHLLEDDVSIFEFKVTRGEYSDGEEYARWLRRGGHYTNVFKLLSRLLGVREAYHALPALVRAAYTSTYPVTSFASLLGHVLSSRHLFSSLDHSSVYYVRLIDWLLAATDIIVGLPVDYKKTAYEDEFEYLGRFAMEYYIEEQPSHPLQPMAAELWSRYRDQALSEDWLFEPFKYIMKDGKTVRNDFVNLQPPLTLCMYNSPGISPGDFLSVESPLYTDRYVPGSRELGQALGYSAYMLELTTMKNIVWALFSNSFARSSHICVHADCPYYPTDLCKKHLRVPDRFEDCSFPKDLQGYIGRKLDPRTNMLMRTQED
jgi:hypothetical protein